MGHLHGHRNVEGPIRRGPTAVGIRPGGAMKPLMLFKDITMGPRTRAHDYLDVGRTGIQVFLKGSLVCDVRPG